MDAVKKNDCDNRLRAGHEKVELHRSIMLNEGGDKEQYYGEELSISGYCEENDEACVPVQASNR